MPKKVLGGFPSTFLLFSVSIPCTQGDLSDDYYSLKYNNNRLTNRINNQMDINKNTDTVYNYPHYQTSG
jgi:hypothetical protein